MTVDESIQEKQCNMSVELWKNNTRIFSETIGVLQAQYATLGQLSVDAGPVYINGTYRIDVS